MEIKYNITLMTLLLFLLVLIILLNNFKLISISNSYYANFNYKEIESEEELVKFIFQLSDQAILSNEIKNTLAKVVDQSPADVKFLLYQAREKGLIEDGQMMLSSLEEVENNYSNNSLDYKVISQQLKKRTDLKQVILIVDKEIRLSKESLAYLAKLNQAGIKIHLIRLPAKKSLNQPTSEQILQVITASE